MLCNYIDSQILWNFNDAEKLLKIVWIDWLLIGKMSPFTLNRLWTCFRFIISIRLWFPIRNSSTISFVWSIIIQPYIWYGRWIPYGKSQSNGHNKSKATSQSVIALLFPKACTLFSKRSAHWFRPVHPVTWPWVMSSLSNGLWTNSQHHFTKLKLP